ncbi:hypothetical protein TNIN_248231 [Trichonephila inaurata madagascariensis]|uniref:Uncharacterized protein n=1 Tax=Trichonephila inaurata madagascariensis TaxID=2747483 RepID=A0A8X6Y4Y9_9ARAC|nr:hypothetical protein TNIN_248231 [Trichonephila inaurata madagascariensis]
MVEEQWLCWQKTKKVGTAFKQPLGESRGAAGNGGGREVLPLSGWARFLLLSTHIANISPSVEKEEKKKPEKESFSDDQIKYNGSLRLPCTNRRRNSPSVDKNQKRKLNRSRFSDSKHPLK